MGPIFRTKNEKKYFVDENKFNERFGIVFVFFTSKDQLTLSLISIKLSN